MNRRKFLNIVGCCGCSYIINSCASVPITDRKQLNLIPEAKLNAQAAQIYEKVKEKEKLSKDTKIGKIRILIIIHKLLLKNIFQEIIFTLIEIILIIKMMKN